MRWAVLVMVLFLLSTAAPAMEVTYLDGRPARSLEPLTADSLLYYRFDEIVSVLGGSWSWIPLRRRATLRVEQDSVAVTVDSPFFVVNSHGLHMTSPVLYRRGLVWVPGEFLLLTCRRLESIEIQWIHEADSLVIGHRDGDIHIASLRQDSLETSLGLVLPSQASWTISPVSGDSCTVTILDAILSLDEIDTLKTKAPLRRITAQQLLGRAYLTLHFTTTEISVHASQPSGGGLLTITVEEMAENAAPLSTRDPSGPIRTVVIDPGHGGEDHGTRSPQGIEEKDVALSLAKILAKLLRRRLPEAEVLLTRQDDIGIPLRKRAESANHWGGDLFISLHCNSSFNRSAKGFQVFFLSPAVTDQARAVAAMENAVIVLPEPEPGFPDTSLAFSLWDMVQNAYLSASNDLARAITDAARSRLDTAVLKPAQASLFVLNGLDMPSVLIEVGYLSNPMEARRLRDQGYLEQVALAIAEGIESFEAERLRESNTEPPLQQETPAW